MLERAFPLVLLAIFTLLARPSTRTTSQDEQELRRIETTTGRGEQKNDVSVMSVFASDWVASSTKKVLSRQQAEENIKTNFLAHDNGPNPYTIEKKNMQVYLFGDTAVVTYIKEYRQTRDTTQFFDEDDTDVFKRGSKGWLVQFSKISAVVDTPAN